MVAFSAFGMRGPTSRERVIPPRAKPTATIANTRTAPKSKPMVVSPLMDLSCRQHWEKAAQCTEASLCVKGRNPVDFACPRRHLRGLSRTPPTYDFSADLLPHRRGPAAGCRSGDRHADRRRSARTRALYPGEAPPLRLPIHADRVLPRPLLGEVLRGRDPLHRLRHRG